MDRLKRLESLNTRISQFSDLDKTYRAAGADAKFYMNDLDKWQREANEHRRPLDEYVEGWDSITRGNIGLGSAGRPVHTRVDNEITIREEDLQKLHDINVNKIRIDYTTLSPNLSVKIDTVAQTTDIDKVIRRFAEGCKEMARSDLRRTG
jgi:hypothetical protein